MKNLKVEFTINGKKIIIEIVNEGGYYSTYYGDDRLMTGLNTVEEAVTFTKKFLTDNKSGAIFIFDENNDNN